MTRLSLTPLRLRDHTTVKNRVVVTAHSYNFTTNNAPDERLVSYVAERIEGGVGCLILGETQVLTTYLSNSDAWGSAVSTDACLPAYRELAGVAERHGAHVFEQLSHPGSQTWPMPGSVAQAPSRSSQAVSGLVATEMTERDISEVREAFVEAAIRAYTGGLSGVELKSDQGKLLHQFIDPKYNRRSDRWGITSFRGYGLLREIVSRIRENTSSGFCIGIRLGPPSHMRLDQDWPQSMLDYVPVLRELDLDYISLSTGSNEDLDSYAVGHPDELMASGLPLKLGRALKEVCSTAILLTGGIDSLAQIDELVGKGVGDLFGMTRAHIADPHIVEKTIGGADDRVRPCIRCNQSCVGRTWEGLDLRCIHNPRTSSRPGRGKATQSPRVVVLGGGPAGLTAAVAAVELGANVQVFEASRSLGGRLKLSMRVDSNSRQIEVATYLMSELARFGTGRVSVDTLAVLQPEDLENLRCDVVVVATGCSELEAPHGAVTFGGYLGGDAPRAGARVALVDEDRTQNPVAIAAHLVRRGYEVQVFTQFESFYENVNPVVLARAMHLLRLTRTPIQTFSKLVAINDTTVIIEDMVTGRIDAIDDIEMTIVLSPGVPTGPGWMDSGMPTISVGDAVFPSGVEVATRSAYGTVARWMENYGTG